MAEHDIWEERYLSLIPEKLTAVIDSLKGTHL